MTSKPLYEPKLVVPYELRCYRCNRVASNVCSICKRWYCSEACILASCGVRRCIPRYMNVIDNETIYTRIPDNDIEFEMRKIAERLERLDNEDENSYENKNIATPVPEKANCANREPNGFSPDKSSPNDKTKQDVNKEDVKTAPIELGKLTEVIIIHVEDDSEPKAWVSLITDVKKANLINDKCEAIKLESKRPALNELYVANFEDTWCRAKLIRMDPLAIFYIDYGNVELVSASKLFACPDEFLSLKHLAFQVQFLPDQNLNARKIPGARINIKGIEMLENGILLCEIVSVTSVHPIEQSKQQAPTRPERSRNIVSLLSCKETCSFVINNVIGSNILIGYVVIDSTSKSYLPNNLISEKLKGVKPDPKYNPKLYDDVVTKIGNNIHRARIMSLNPLKVALVDFGLIKPCEKVAKLNDLVDILESAAMCFLREPVKTDNILQLYGCSIPIHLLEGGKRSIHLEGIGDAEISPWEPMVEHIGLQYDSYKNNDKVVMSRFYSPKSVFLKKANIAKSEINWDKHFKDGKSMNRLPYYGEMVLVKILNRCNRAQVLDVTSQENIYDVMNVENGNIEPAPLEDMKLMSNDLKMVPCEAKEFQLYNVSGSLFTRKNASLLVGLVDKETFTMKYVGGLNQVQLTTTSSTRSLNEILEINQHSCYFEKDINYQNWEIEEELVIYNMLTHYKFQAAAKAYSDVAAQIYDMSENCFKPYCEKGKPYEPELNEVCLVFEKSDAYWARAICTKISGKKFTFYFIDDTAEVIVGSEFIRQITPEFILPACQLKTCLIYGLSNINKLTKDMVTSIIKKNCIVKAFVVKQDKDFAIVYIPMLNEELEKLGHKIPIPLIISH